MADFGTLLGKIADVVMGNGDTGRPRVGVLLEGTTGQAPVIKQVEPGSPAHNAGLLQGDRLLSVSATNIPSRTVELRGFHAEQCSGLLKEMFRDATLAGGKIILQVERFQGGAVQVFLAELGKSPQELAKVIARSGLCSRREAVRLILDGRVEVNRAVVKECGTRVGVADMVTVDGKVIDAEPPTTVVVALHKPKEFVTTTHDPAGRRTVYDLLPQHWQQLRSVGRLDYMTEGLLLFTNNGALQRFKGDFCLPLYAHTDCLCV